MRHFGFCLALVAAFAFGGSAQASGGPFHFSSRAEGQVAATQADGYFEALGAYELRLRAADLGKASAADVREQHREAVREWDDAGKSKVTASLGRIGARLEPFRALLPRRVELVAVDNTYEDGLPHTRGHAIFLPPAINTVSDDLLDFIMAHEIFHVLSRESTIDRDAFYESIGFRSCRFEAPASLSQRHITNPDAPVDAHYVTVGDERFVPYIFGSSDQVTKPLQLGESLMTRLVSVGVDSGKCTPLSGADGGPVLKKASDVPNFFDVVGKDSTYVSHPEELLADNFALLLTKPEASKSPDRLQLIDTVLKSAAAGKASAKMPR